MFQQVMALQNSPTYRRSLAERLERERMAKNNGTIPGGLASMIDAGTAAYLRMRDEGDRSKAQEALVGGMTKGAEWGTPDGQQPNAPRMEPGIGAAKRNLAQLKDNPYAGRLTQMLAFEEMERQREAARLADQRAYESSIYSRNRADQLSDIQDQRQWELSNRPKPQRRIIQGKDGVPYYEDGTPVLSGVEAPPPDTTGVEDDVRSEFNKLPVVKDYNSAKAGYEKVLSAAKGGTAVDDIALIFGYMKTIDPTSTVREGEFATAEQTGGIPDRVVNIYNKALNGERLTPEQRRMFAESAYRQFKVYQDAYSQARDFYENQVLGERGNVNRALPPYSSLTAPQFNTQPDPGAGQDGIGNVVPDDVDDLLKKYGVR